MDVRSQLKKKEDKIRAYYSRMLNSTTDSKVISNYARKSYKIQRSRKAGKGGSHGQKDAKVPSKILLHTLL